MWAVVEAMTNGWASGLPLRFSFDGKGLRVPMFAIYECAVCVLAVWIGMTLLFMACAVFLVLAEGCSIAEPKIYDHTGMGIPLIGRWLAVGTREP